MLSILNAISGCPNNVVPISNGVTPKIMQLLGESTPWRFCDIKEIQANHSPFDRRLSNAQTLRDSNSLNNFLLSSDEAPRFNSECFSMARLAFDSDPIEEKPVNNEQRPSDEPPPLVDFDTLDWQLSKKHSTGDIEVFSARVPGQPLSALRGITVFRTTKEQLFSVLLDVPNYPRWMDGVARTHLLDDDNPHLCDYVTIANASWPFSPRYDILHPSVTETDNNVCRFTTRSNPDRELPDALKGPGQRSMERLGHTECRFTIEKLNEDEVKFIYDIHVGSDKNINHSVLRLFDPMSYNLMEKTMNKLRDYLQTKDVI